MNKWWLEKKNVPTHWYIVYVGTILLFELYSPATPPPPLYWALYLYSDFVTVYSLQYPVKFKTGLDKLKRKILIQTLNNEYRNDKVKIKRCVVKSTEILTRYNSNIPTMQWNIILLFCYLIIIFYSYNLLY